MKKVLAFIAAALMTGCVQNQNKEAAQLSQYSVEQLDGSEEITPIDTVEVRQRVTEMYDEIFALYNKSDEAADGALQMFNDMFLSRDFRNLDSTLSARQSDEVFPDYDHWIQGQDWQNLSYSIDTISTLPGSRAMVQMNIVNFGHPQALQLIMVKDDSLWMIDDFVTEFSEKQAMKELLQK